MKKEELIKKKIAVAEKAVQELIKAGNLKKLPDAMAAKITLFYETKALNRLKSAQLIYNASKEKGDYSDYSEATAASYYAMYYIVHAYLAKIYRTKLRENLRGVHATTHHIILYYLVKTKRLAAHLYDEYVATLETTADVQNLSPDTFQPQAFSYAEKYDRSRSARETFTYNTTVSIESYHAEQAIATAEEFINTIRQLMVKKK
jgi:uncharacterized protein (UPF0332 family)